MLRSKFALNIVILFFVLTSVMIMLQLERGGFFTSTSNPDAADAFMTGVTYTSFDPKGQVKSLLKVSRMNHQAQNDVLNLFQPFLKVFTENHIPWEITSKYGTSYKNNQKIIFNQNVLLHQLAEPNNPETTISTSKLIVFPRSSFAQTDQWISVSQPNMHLTGDGATADLKNGNIQILKQPRGTYAAEPQSH